MTIMNDSKSGGGPRSGSAWALGVAALSLGLCTGCALSKPCQTPPPFHLSLQGAERLNLDDRGRSTAVILHVMQLKDITGIDVAGFKDVWEREEGGKPVPFTKDLLHETELVVAPGSEVTRWIKRDPAAYYVVAAAKVRKSLGRTWYAVYQLHPVPEYQCSEQPVEPSKRPSNADELIHFKVEDYNIRYSRPESSVFDGLNLPRNGRDG
jgi:type VI secretion system VasD/TssJ family lipoprotein